MSASNQYKVRVGISSCLLGAEVRFDGGHKRDAFITGALSRYFDYVPVCPEVAIGLGTPREPIRLVADAGQPRAVGVKDPSLDVTQALSEYGRETATRLQGIAGYIVKRGSPSCGMERVKIYSAKGMPAKQGIGVFTRALVAEAPLLPIEEEGRLNDPALRENFILRVFVYDRWQKLVAAGVSAKGLVEFHSRHKYLLLAHDTGAYRQLGRLVAGAGSAPLGELGRAYISGLMNALREPARRRRHVNVLQHLAGYLKRSLDSTDRSELAEVIEAYRRGEYPLVVPLTLLKHHFRRSPDSYIAQQYYLDPHPQALLLRNHI
ncbi:MAG: hypothetical protein AMS22_00175 [Thiotrichales bacterium SG8_50]|nr:MAG: hypothetical protein AMS22_00175 [Thiotrichales bacterium SG8_50]